MSRERTDLQPPDQDKTQHDHRSALVRPYAVTGGRTATRYQLQVEAMVAASHQAHELSVLSPECEAILRLCQDWRSVAEISAELRMPLEVTRVLVADMAAEGLVKVHQLNRRPDLGLLEGVLAGLRKLPLDHQEPEHTGSPTPREILQQAEREIEDALILDTDAGLADVKSRALRVAPKSADQHASDQES